MKTENLIAVLSASVVVTGAVLVPNSLLKNNLWHAIKHRLRQKTGYRRKNLCVYVGPWGTIRH